MNTDDRVLSKNPLWGLISYHLPRTVSTTLLDSIYLGTWEYKSINCALKTQKSLNVRLTPRDAVIFAEGLAVNAEWLSVLEQVLY